MASQATLLPFHLGSNDLSLSAAERSTFARLAEEAPKGINVCVGKEWYRFPSSFFLPELKGLTDDTGLTPRVRLQFVKSSFAGQLPQHFLEGLLSPTTCCPRVNETQLN